MLKRKTVLIVEDEFLIAELLEEMLRDLGYTGVAIAKNVPEATDAVKTKPDLVILDLNLGGQSAIPVAQLLRDKNVPFIISSGYNSNAIDAEWQKYPVLTKPYGSDALQAKIAQAVAMETL